MSRQLLIAYSNTLTLVCSVPLESARARALQAVEFYNSNVLASNNNNNNNPASGATETYKSLGDVFGIQAAVSSINSDKFGHVQGKMGHARSVTDVYKHIPSGATLRSTGGSGIAHHPHRVSTYSNVSVPVNTNNPNRFGSADMRASYNETRRYAPSGSHHPQQQYMTHQPLVGGGAGGGQTSQRSFVYKSNSSLDLDHEVAVVQEAVSSVNLNSGFQQVRRDFGSQGSINDLKSFEHDLPPAAVSTLQRRPMLTASSAQQQQQQLSSADFKSEGGSTAGSVMSNGSQDFGGSADSPKLGKKLKNKSQKSLFKKLRVGGNSSNSSNRGDDSTKNSVDSASVNAGNSTGNESRQADRQAVLDDRHRRRFFSHYDIGSLCSSLRVSSQLKSLERRNTPTGASAASAALRGTEDNKDEADQGDQVSNDLVLR